MRRLLFLVMAATVLAGGIAVGQTPPSALGTVRLPRSVKADGKPLAAGVYQVRLGDDDLTPGPGQSAGSERWIEFVHNGKIVAREVATVVPASEIRTIAKGPIPRLNTSRVELLEGGGYIRVWINRAGTNYLINMPPT